MESLVEIAKRININNDPNMDDKTWKDVEVWIGKQFGNKHGAWLWNQLYRYYKHGMTRDYNKKQVKQNLAILKTTSEEGVRVRNQDGELASIKRDDVFVHHSAWIKGRRIVDRVQMDLDIDRENTPELFKKLDKFIKKHQAIYKVTDVAHVDRTDTVNLYLPERMTPEIMLELYDVVKDHINGKHHDFLNGFEVKRNGKVLSGIKTAPEPRYGSSALTSEQQREINRHLLQDLGPKWGPRAKVCDWGDKASLGQLWAKKQYLDLIYYLAGKEGQNPFSVDNQLGERGHTPYTPPSFTDEDDKTEQVETTTQKENTMTVLKEKDITKIMAEEWIELAKSQEILKYKSALQAYITAIEKRALERIPKDSEKKELDVVIQDENGKDMELRCRWNQRTGSYMVVDIPLSQNVTVDWGGLVIKKGKKTKVWYVSAMDEINFYTDEDRLTPVLSMSKSKIQAVDDNGNTVYTVSLDKNRQPVEVVIDKREGNKKPRIIAKSDKPEEFDRVYSVVQDVVQEAMERVFRKENAEQVITPPKKEDAEQDKKAEVEEPVVQKKKEKTPSSRSKAANKVKKSMKDVMISHGGEGRKTVHEKKTVEIPDLTKKEAINRLLHWNDIIDTEAGFPPTPEWRAKNPKLSKLLDKIVNAYEDKKGAKPVNKLNSLVKTSAEAEYLTALAKAFQEETGYTIPIIKHEILVAKRVVVRKKTTTEENSNQERKGQNKGKDSAKALENYEVDFPDKRWIRHIVTNGNKRTIEEIWFRPNKKLATRYTHDEVRQDGAWRVVEPSKEERKKIGAALGMDSQHNIARVDVLTQKATEQYRKMLSQEWEKARIASEQAKAKKELVEGTTYAFTKVKGSKTDWIVTQYETVKTANGFRRVVTEYHASELEDSGKVGQPRYAKAYTHIEELDAEGNLQQEQLPVSEKLRDKLMQGKTDDPTISGRIDYDNARHIAKVTYMTDGEIARIRRMWKNQNHYKIEKLILPPSPGPKPAPVPDPKPAPVPGPEPEPIPGPKPAPVPGPEPEPIPDPKPEPKPKEQDPIDWRNLKNWDMIERKGPANKNLGPEDVVRFLDASRLSDEEFSKMKAELTKAGIKFVDPKKNMPADNGLRSKYVPSDKMDKNWWNKLSHVTREHISEGVGSFSSSWVKSAINDTDKTVVVAGYTDNVLLNKLLNKQRPSWWKRNLPWLVPVVGAAAALWLRFAPMEGKAPSDFGDDHARKDRTEEVQEGNKQLTEGQSEQKVQEEDKQPAVGLSKQRKVTPPKVIKEKSVPKVSDESVVIDGVKISRKDLLGVTVDAQMYTRTVGGGGHGQGHDIYKDTPVIVYVGVDSLVRNFGSGDMKDLTKIIDNLRNGDCEIASPGRYRSTAQVNSAVIRTTDYGLFKSPTMKAKLDAHNFASMIEMAKHGVRVHQLLPDGSVKPVQFIKTKDGNVRPVLYMQTKTDKTERVIVDEKGKTLEVVQQGKIPTSKPRHVSRIKLPPVQRQ